MKHDLLNTEDIKLLVDSFYKKVREDDLLAALFNDRIQDRWPLHLEKMYTFWETVLLNVHSYSGSPFAPHAKLPVNKTHFNRWLELFYSSIDEHFYGDKANEAKWRAEKMAEMFYNKLVYYQNNPDNLIL